MPKKAFILILTVGLLSLILGAATISWFHDIETSQGNVFQAGIWGQPRLWIWRHGAKVWPEWQVGYTGETQVLHARIVNNGNRSAYVKVEFILLYSGSITVYRENSTIAECDGVPPGNATVSSPPYNPTLPGTYYIKAKLWYSFDTIHWKLWLEFQDEFGGEGVSRTASSKFKVRG